MHKAVFKEDPTIDQEITFRRLRIYNLVMSIFHAAQGILMVWLSSDFTLPIRTNYLLFDTATRKLVTAPKLRST